MRKPFFTIVTPTLNSEKYLEECIKSVESQSFKDWEHIFIDSYSTDETISILNAYKKRHPNKVRIYKYPKKGISDAFNKGIKHSRGKYLNFLGSDDLLEKKSLEIVYKKMKSDEYSWCYGDVKIIDEFSNLVKIKKYNTFSYTQLFYFFYICHQSVFFRNILFTKYGLYNINLKYAMDHDFILRIGKTETSLKINKPICSFRKTSYNASNKNWREVLLEKKKVNKLYFDKSDTILFIIYTISYLKRILI